VVLISDVEIGQDAVVASGALVTRDVPPAKLVAGFPARVWRAVSADNGHRKEPA
jgi:acetyltransferase-like isoleucine patch superfamily enzyme